MITFEQALNLKYGDTLLDNQGQRWRVNGNVQTWKRSPTRLRVPLKHGLYSYDALLGSDFDKNGVADNITLEA